MRLGCALLAHKDDPYLPIAEKWYGKCGDVHIYTDPGHSTYEEFLEWHKQEIHRAQSDMLSRYDMAVVADCDDLLIADPTQYKHLKQFAETVYHTGWDYVTAEAYEVWDMSHAPEGYARDDKRMWCHEYTTHSHQQWIRDKSYDKTLISSQPLRYSTMFGLDHGLEQKYYPGLYMIYLRKADYYLCLKRYAFFAHGKNLPQGHHWTLEDEAYRNWFYDIENKRYMLTEEIPDRFWKELTCVFS